MSIVNAVRRGGAVLVVLGLLAAGGAPSSLPRARAQEALDDIWLYHASTDTLERVTAASGDRRESTAARVSADGRLVVFQSDADFHAEGIPGGTYEIWLYDAATRDLRRITEASDPSRDSRRPSISADGTTAVFESDSDLLHEGIPAGQREIWRYGVVDGALTRLTRSPAGSESGGAVVSADGSVVVFHSTAAFDALESSGTSFDIWRLDTRSNDLVRITQTDAGRNSGRPTIDADATTIAFESDDDLLGREGVAGQREVWLYRAETGTLSRVTTGNGPTRESEYPHLSADGATLAFHSDADLLGEGRPDAVDEIWLCDVATGSLRRVTSTWVPERDAGSNTVLHPDSQNPRLTADGQVVVFASDGDLLGEGLPNGIPHTWRYEVATGKLTRIDTSAGTGSGPAISANAGTIVLFRTGFDQIRMMRLSMPLPPPRPDRLAGDVIARDLADFRREIEERWAYLRSTGVDYEGALADLALRARDGMAFDEYAIELQKIVSLFVDGHAGVGGVRYPDGFLPFLVEPAGDRFVALLPDRSGFVDAERPYVAAIDGRPIAEWIDAARPFSPQGSPQYQTRHVRSATSSSSVG